jgi:choline dehydrogenase-like flavoprotein
MNVPTHQHYDHIVVGSGAGGAAAAYELARHGKCVLLLEKGPDLPRDGSTLDVTRVIRHGEFKSKELWLDKHGTRFAPEEYFNWGGKTRWYGAALLRYDHSEFAAEEGFDCKPWPIDYDELAPYYAQAEALLGVREFAIEPSLQKILSRLQRGGTEWQVRSLPLGLLPQITQDQHEAQHFDGFASVRGLKGDAETGMLAPIRARANVTVRTEAPVTALLPGTRTTEIAGVRTDDGNEYHGDTVILAAGALHSPRLLADYLHAQKVSSDASGTGLIGRFFKRHLLTAVVALSNRRQGDLLRKTALLLSTRFPHSSVQPLGFNTDVLTELMPGLLPRAVSEALAARAYGFFLQTEDGSHASNQVRVANGRGLPSLDYDPARTPESQGEHAAFVSAFRRALFSAGFVSGAQTIPLSGTAHACGTLIAGTHPQHSVVNAYGRVHAFDNVFVADGSVLPRSSRVNPSLTIYAWGLRLGARLASGQPT